MFAAAAVISVSCTSRAVHCTVAPLQSTGDFTIYMLRKFSECFLEDRRDSANKLKAGPTVFSVIFPLRAVSAARPVISQHFVIIL